jgi:DNA-binding LytR/AlgR family response regulator
MISCIAIDDEPLALEILKKYVQKIYFLELKGTFTNPDEAVQFIRQEKPELIFLDIQMPDISGIQLASQVQQYNPAIIFTTAYSEYAVEGFNVDAVDYLLKPIDYERFLKAVYKAKEYLEFTQSRDISNTSIFVKSDYQQVKVKLSDIQFIEALDDFIKIYLPDKTLITLMTLKAIQQKLPEKEFIRVHRSYIVPLSKLEVVSRAKVRIGDKEVPIGASYSDAFFALVNGKF